LHGVGFGQTTCTDSLSCIHHVFDLYAWDLVSLVGQYGEAAQIDRPFSNELRRQNAHQTQLSFSVTLKPEIPIIGWLSLPRDGF
jgi:hypothetical protein